MIMTQPGGQQSVSKCFGPDSALLMNSKAAGRFAGRGFVAATIFRPASIDKVNENSKEGMRRVSKARNRQGSPNSSVPA